VIEVELDREIFSGEVVARTAHRFSGRYQIEIISTATTFRVTLLSKGEPENAQEVASAFRNEALDERLRESTRTQTSDLQAVLLRAALEGAQTALKAEK
jgi:His-Xaa-Ser system protein HxsD